MPVVDASTPFDFQKDGVCILKGVVDVPVLKTLVSAASQLIGKRGGARVTCVPDVLRPLITKNGALTQIASRLLDSAARPVRVLAFDKSADRNWGLSWHQDRAIPVAVRVEAPGFKNWTVKHGVNHVEAPADVLQQMVALRLHLDDCDMDNGPLEVARGSHLQGRRTKQSIAATIVEFECVPCLASAGDILAMRGLCVHRSAPAKLPRHRRVIHVDYACCELPGAVEWASV